MTLAIFFEDILLKCTFETSLVEERIQNSVVDIHPGFCTPLIGSLTVKARVPLYGIPQTLDAAVSGPIRARPSG